MGEGPPGVTCGVIQQDGNVSFLIVRIKGDKEEGVKEEGVLRG